MLLTCRQRTSGRREWLHRLSFTKSMSTPHRVHLSRKEQRRGAKKGLWRSVYLCRTTYQTVVCFTTWKMWNKRASSRLHLSWAQRRAPQLTESGIDKTQKKPLMCAAPSSQTPSTLQGFSALTPCLLLSAQGEPDSQDVVYFEHSSLIDKNRLIVFQRTVQNP